VGWEKVACNTKAAISLKRVQIDEKVLWGAYRKLPTPFPMAPSPTPYGLPFPNIGVRTTPKKSNRYYLRNWQSYELQTWPVAYIQRAHPNKSPLKILEKRECGRIQGCPIFSGTPYYLRNGKSYGFQIWPVYPQGPSQQKPIKNFRQKGAWAYPGAAQFFWVPPIISGRGKLRISNLANTFRGSI